MIKILTPESIKILRAIYQLPDDKVSQLVELNDNIDRDDVATLGLLGLQDITRQWKRRAIRNALAAEQGNVRNG